MCSSGILLENFPVCKELLIPPGTQNYVVRMRLYDTNKRLLCLTIRIILRAQGALKILISAPYWLINKTGNVIFVNKDYICTDFTITKINVIAVCVIALRPPHYHYHFLKLFSSVRSAIDFPSGQWQSRCCRSV